LRCRLYVLFSTATPGISPLSLHDALPIWARELGALNGITVPVFPVEHFYAVTRPIAGVSPDLPVLRDYDGHIYVRAHARNGPCQDRKSTRLNSSHDQISYAVFCLKKKNQS